MTTNCVPGTEYPTDTVITTRAEQAALTKQARADALREAADKVRSFCTVPSHQIIFDAIANDLILSLIDQPPEDVYCEWEKDGVRWNNAHYTGCRHGITYSKEMRYCPFCGKPIKVKE